MNHILVANNIEKTYSGSIILDNASLHIKQGEIYGLVGKNGSGKTTLLRILTGLIQTFNGTVVFGNSNAITPKVSIVINDPSLFLNMSAYENMKMQSILLRVNNKDKIKAALKKVGLESCGHKLVKHFSLGMTQRLKLGMTLLENPDILILDEPINGLDPDGIAELRGLLLSMNRNDGVTILISSHILSELENLATCFGILHNGKVIKELSIGEIKRDGRNLEDAYLQYTKGGFPS